jgi:hypothetical protein
LWSLEAAVGADLQVRLVLVVEVLVVLELELDCL